MKQVLVVLLVAALAGGGYFGWKEMEARSAHAAAVQQVVDDGEALLRGERLDPSAAQAVIREISGLQGASDTPALLRVHARLLLALQRPEAARKVIAPLILALEPAAEDRAIGARIFRRLHGLRGDAELAGQAADYAEGHYEQTGAVETLFLAWQCARRADRQDDAERLSGLLLDQHRETPHGRLVAALADEGTEMSDLLSLEVAFAALPASLDGALLPEEVEFAIAHLLLRDAKEDDSGQLTEAIRRLENILTTFPADPASRAYMAFALHRSGDRAARNAHLDWLLRNVPQDDPRREEWARIRAEGSDGGR